MKLWLTRDGDGEYKIWGGPKPTFLPNQRKWVESKCSHCGNGTGRLLFASESKAGDSDWMKGFPTLRLDTCIEITVKDTGAPFVK